MKHTELDAEARDAFRLFDADGDGVLDLFEARVALRALGHDVSHQEALSLFGGPADATTFLAVSRRLGRPPGAVSRAFALFAGDKDHVTRADLARVSREVGEPLGDDELDAMVAEFDARGDGRIDRETFARIVGDALG